MANSTIIILSADRNKNKESGVLRFYNDNTTETIDLLRGHMKSNIKIGDAILIRENKSPTYHLASCLDDLLHYLSLVNPKVDLPWSICMFYKYE